MAASSIEWTEATWNPVTGCTEISPGCEHCYASRMAKRLQAMGQYNYRNGFTLTLQPHMLDHPLHWRKPRRIFVNSMSDLFHRDVPLDYIQRVFDVMRRAHWHQFQVLTKRARRLVDVSEEIEWPRNVWMGVSVESAEYEWRIDYLRQTGAIIKFLSVEPLVAPLSTMDFSGINWVIVGGESGPKARPMLSEWVPPIRAACKQDGVAFFFKQAGSVLAREWNCEDRKGTDPSEWPKQFQVREYPGLVTSTLAT